MPIRQDEATVLRARDAAFSDGDLQTELPADQFSGFRWDGPSWLGGAIGRFFEVLGILGLVALAGLIIYWMSDRFVSRRRVKRKVAEEKSLAGTRLAIGLDEINSLAERGAYADAIHLLLLETLTELCRLAEIDLDASLTSREIVATIPMPEAAKAALADLVAAVEVSYFGEADVTNSDFLRCRERFDVFVESLAGEEG